MRAIRRIHPIAGITGLLTTLCFWTSTAVSELSGSQAAITAVKLAIPWGLILLAPALAIAGGSGFRMGARSPAPLVVAKRRRMPIIAATGIFILVPAALFLAWKASRSEFDASFMTVQAVELAAGASNITLLARSALDGFRHTGRLGARTPKEPITTAR